MPSRNRLAEALCWRSAPFALAIKACLALCCALPGSGAEDRPDDSGFGRLTASAPSIEGGRLLFNEFGCINCHTAETGLLPREGPDLTGIAQRRNPAWLGRFLLDPQAAKPGSAMPKLLQSDEEAEAILHYIASLTPLPDQESKLFPFANAERGESLYRKIGCASCHGPDPARGSPEGAGMLAAAILRTAGFPKLSEKYDLGTLVSYLQDPYAHHPTSRMPKFALDREEVYDLAAYLIDYHDSNTLLAPRLPQLVPDSDMAERGQKLFAERNCIGCHKLEEKVFTLALPIRTLDQGCLASNPPSRAPRFDLSQPQREALGFFLASAPTGEAPLLTQLEALNCLACHSRDGVGGPSLQRRKHFTGDESLGDSGLLPPPLTDIGWMVRADWLESSLRGETRMRPYLNTRMPSFGPAAGAIATIITKADLPEERSPLPTGHVEAGRKLLGNDGGLNCITCHRWSERDSLGIQGLDLSNLSDRLRPSWFAQYLVNPAGYNPTTLMPTFWPKGRATNQTILDGNTNAQIASIYAFAKSGEGLPDGFPEVGSKAFEIVPENRPVVQRTFMEGVGTYAILVGFPEGIHLAYDGLAGQPAKVWKGRFFDAYNTWFSRFPPMEKPLGEVLADWPEREAEAAVKFRGYRLDDEGVPEFLTTINGEEYVERFEPYSDEGGRLGLRREIRRAGLQALDVSLFAHPSSAEVEDAGKGEVGRQVFIYKW